MKQTIRLTESQLRGMIQEAVNSALNELDARTYANYARGRQAQANTALQNGDNEGAYNLQMKANIGTARAQQKWNQQFGYNYDKGDGNYGYQQMGGSNVFTHNGNTNYGINSKHGYVNSNGKRNTANYAYNPKNNTEWNGDGQGNSSVSQHKFDTGDNGAHRIAHEMEHGTGKYIKGKGWQ